MALRRSYRRPVLRPISRCSFVVGYRAEHLYHPSGSWRRTSRKSRLRSPQRSSRCAPGFSPCILLTQTKNSVSALEAAPPARSGLQHRLEPQKHKFMRAMKERDDSQPLQGLIQVDDAYWGGERHASSTLPHRILPSLQPPIGSWGNAFPTRLDCRPYCAGLLSNAKDG